MPPEKEQRVHEKTYLVTEKEAINFMGPDVPRVLSTPSLAMWMEMTARESVAPLLQPSEDTVGTSLSIKHLAATPTGVKVRVVSTLMQMEGRAYTFNVEAYDEVEKIGEATHQRVSVNIGKFVTRVAAKGAKARESR